MNYTISLKQNTCFKKLYYQGKFRAGKLIVVYILKKRQSGTRLGITVSKKVGKATKRNRVRRIILSAYRKLEKTLNLQGFDVVIVARQPALFKKSTDIEKELIKIVPFLIKKVGKK